MDVIVNLGSINNNKNEMKNIPVESTNRSKTEQNANQKSNIFDRKPYAYKLSK